MTFLFPTMLIGLAALALPVVLHLIARHKYQVLEFPSTQLLRPDERSNVFAMRLVDVGQLLLRLLVVLLLVLAMSRLFVSWLPFGRAPRNLIVLVDCSASLRASAPRAPDAAPRTTPRRLIDAAREKAAELLRTVRAPSQCALVAAGDDVAVLAPLRPIPEPALAALDRIEATDGTGRGLVHAVARCCDMVRGRREMRSQIVVLTDLCASAFETRTQRDLARIQAARDDLGDALDIVFLDLSTGRARNLAIVQATLRGPQAGPEGAGDVKVGDDAHVVARVVNSSTSEQTAKVRLAVGRRREAAAREISLEPGAQADLDLPLRVSRAVRTFVEARLEADDAVDHDNAFVMPLDVTDARRVLIVAGAADETRAGELSALGEEGTDAPPPDESQRLDGPTLLRLVLNPGRELGRAHGTGIRTTMVTPEAFSAQPLSQYDVVVLYGVSALPEQALRDLDRVARNGRALLFVSTAGVNAAKFNRTFAAAGTDRGVLAPASLGNERKLAVPVGVGTGSGAHPLLAPFRDRLRGDLSTIRFTSLRETRALSNGAAVAVRATDGRPLAVEMPIGQGRAMLLTFGVELDRGNIARTRAFPAFMWHLTSYLTGQLERRPPDLLTAARPAVLDVSEPQFAFLNELDIEQARAEANAEPPRRVAINAERTVLVPGLPAGRYTLRKPQPAGAGAAAPRSAYARQLAVNPDPRESATQRIGRAGLEALFGGQARMVGATEAAELSPAGGEMWLLLVVFLALAYAAEGAVGWLLSARRERLRGAPGTGASQ